MIAGPVTTRSGSKREGNQIQLWLAGVFMLAGLVLLVTHFSELADFVLLLRRAQPAWLLLALLLQSATYVFTAAVWYLALRQAGQSYSLLSLTPLGIAKLFSDQVIPSGGMSGTAFFMAALQRRGVPPNLCMASLLLSLVSYYAVYLLAATATILILWLHHAIHPWIIAVAGIFCVVAVGIPVGVLILRHSAGKVMPGYLQRVPGMSKLLQALAHAPAELISSPALVFKAALFHASIFLLDATTLWVTLQVVGTATSFWVVFPSFVLASMVATVGVIPLGLGTFEVSCVSMLHLLGVSLEAALAATLLLRGFTLWLPMLPGMWLTRRELR